ncbi:MAG TPA: hypothetical protein VF101_17060 [Gaiellaceae bacterium]
MLAGMVSLTLGGFAAAGAFAVDGLSFALTTTGGTPTVPSPDPAPKPPPPPKHVSPPPPPPAPPPAPSPPPPPAYVAPPPPAYVAPPPPAYVAPPPPPAPTRPLIAHSKPKRRHAAKPHIALPIPVSRGSGGPARADLVYFGTPVAMHATHVAAIAPPTTDGSSRARLFFLIATALGTLLVIASALPGPALRPAFVHEVVAVHRLDLALVGGAIVVLVSALYLLAT